MWNASWLKPIDWNLCNTSTRRCRDHANWKYADWQRVRIILRNPTCTLLLTTKRRTGLRGGSGPWMKHQICCSMQLKNIRHLIRSVLCTSWRCGLLTVDWYRIHTNCWDPSGFVHINGPCIAQQRQLRSVMNYRELKHLDIFTAKADVCAAKLRELHWNMFKVAIPDLRWAVCRPWVTGGISHSDKQKNNILLNALEVWLQYDAAIYESYRQYCVDPRWVTVESHIKSTTCMWTRTWYLQIRTGPNWNPYV